MNKFILSPSLLSADCGKLTETLSNLEHIGIKWVHWDVMDGHFVPNITFGQHVISQMRPRSNLFFDVHLMIDKPERYIHEFKDAGADLICVHSESTHHLHRVVTQIRSLGLKAGVALCPSTPLSDIYYVLNDVDVILIMSVNPGFGGQKFIPSTYDKISKLKSMCIECGAKIDIQVDGGVTIDNASKLLKAGANILVSGSGFFCADDLCQRFHDFLATAKSEQNNEKVLFGGL